MDDNNNDLFGDLVGSPPETSSPTLSHYTSLEGMRSILTHSQLWASNIRFLNDKAEMLYGIDVARKVLKEVLKDKGKRNREIATGRILNGEIPDVYACCFCEQPDLLSQWRGYGSTTQSVSIQFDHERLKQSALAQSANLIKVTYGEKEALKLLRERLSPARIVFYTKYITGITDDNLAMKREILDLSPNFKDEAFDEEREWRITIRSSSNKEVSYRTRDNVIMPYVAIGADQLPLPVRSITVGPGKDTELTKHSIEHFLRSNGRYHGVTVKTTKIPFRV